MINKILKYFFIPLGLLLLAHINVTAADKNNESTESLISMPISLKFSQINTLIENQLDCILYNDFNNKQANNDDTHIKVEKIGILNITGLKSGLKIELPLRIYFLKKLGFFEIKTDFDLTVVLNSSIAIGNKLNIITHTKVINYSITRDPIIGLGGADINIKYIVQLGLDHSLNSIVKEIDNSFAQNDMLFKKAAEMWQYIQQAVIIDSTLGSWIKISPRAVYVEPITIYYDQLRLNAALASEVYTGIGNIPNSALIPFKQIDLKNKLEDYFSLNANIDLPLNDLANYATKLFISGDFKPKCLLS